MEGAMFVITPVAVEKLHLPPKPPKFGDTKCLENREGRL
jgi:hypothetical protein